MISVADVQFKHLKMLRSWATTHEGPVACATFPNPRSPLALAHLGHAILKYLRWHLSGMVHRFQWCTASCPVLLFVFLTFAVPSLFLSLPTPL